MPIHYVEQHSPFFSVQVKPLLSCSSIFHFCSCSSCSLRRSSSSFSFIAALCSYFFSNICTAEVLVAHCLGGSFPSFFFLGGGSVTNASSPSSYSSSLEEATGDDKVLLEQLTSSNNKNNHKINNIIIVINTYLIVSPLQLVSSLHLSSFLLRLSSSLLPSDFLSNQPYHAYTALCLLTAVVKLCILLLFPTCIKHTTEYESSNH